MKNKKKVLILLSCLRMCKFFGHFGVRTLLVLYMVDQLRFLDAQAFGYNAIFCSLSELGAVFGGVLADRYLGLKRTVSLGGWFLTIGYFTLSFEKALIPALAFIIVGFSLFSGNISAILGKIYQEKDPGRVAV